MVEPGQAAPDFTLPDQDGNELTLSELRGQTVAVYKAAGARVIGVSPDPVEDVKKFADKYDLDFTLLADADHAVADAYGTWVEKSMYGKKYWGVQRATFLIDDAGKIAKVFPKVSPKTHDDVVLDALAELSAA